MIHLAYLLAIRETRIVSQAFSSYNALIICEWTFPSIQSVSLDVYVMHKVNHA